VGKLSKDEVSLIQRTIFQRDFPEFEREMIRFSSQDKFIEILNEYCLCEIKIKKYRRAEDMFESYKQLQEELKIELLNFLNKNSLEPRKNNEDSEI
jgi:hypothetical protein